MRSMFTVRRIVQSEGVERTFPVNSPKIAKIEVKRSGKVRRAKLYYLRDRVGKEATRLRERKRARSWCRARRSRRRPPRRIRRQRPRPKTRRNNPSLSALWGGEETPCSPSPPNPGGDVGSAIAPNAPPPGSSVKSAIGSSNTTSPAISARLTSSRSIKIVSSSSRCGSTEAADTSLAAQLGGSPQAAEIDSARTLLAEGETIDGSAGPLRCAGDQLAR